MHSDIFPEDSDGLSVWRVKRCGQEVALAKEPVSNPQVRHLMDPASDKETAPSWSAVTWHHRHSYLIILDRAGGLVKVPS